MAEIVRSHSSKIVSISLIALLGLALRLYGINFGLPYLYHADEPIVVNHAMAYGLGDLNPHFFAIPPLTSYILFAIYALYFLVGKALHLFIVADDFAVAFLSDPTTFYLLGRVFMGALLGTAAIIAMYFFGKKAFSEKTGIIAALFMAIVFIHVQNSHYIYADVPMVLFIVLTCISVLDIVQKSDMKSCVFAGAFAGIATAFKYNAAIIFIVIVLAYLIDRKPGYRLKIVISFVAMAAAFIILNPFSILDMPNFIKGVLGQSGAEYSLGILYHLSYSLIEGLGLMLVITGILGMFYYAVKDPKIHLAFVLFPVIFYSIIAFFSQAHERYVLPLVPFFILYSAAIIGKFTKKKLLIFIMLALILVPNLAKSAYSDYLFSKKDTRTIGARWIEDNIASGSRIAVEHSFFCPRLNQAKKQIEEKLVYGGDDPVKDKRVALALKLADKKTPYYYLFYLKDKSVVNTGFLFERPQLAFSMPDLRLNGIEYVVMHIDTKKDTRTDFYQELLDNAVFLKEFSPYRNKDTQYAEDLTVQTGGPFLGRELFARERNGYIIKIFKLKGT